ncbi:MAG: hypothetical protein ACXVA0_24085 [Mucilaginibacter sp.]
MENYLIIGAVVVGVLGLVCLFKYLKSKNVITVDEVNQVATVATDAIVIAEKIVNDLNLSDGTTKTINQVLDISDKVVEYVHDLGGVTSIEDKNKFAIDTINAILDKLKVTVKDSDKSLIQTVVSESLNWFK